MFTEFNFTGIFKEVKLFTLEWLRSTKLAGEGLDFGYIHEVLNRYLIGEEFRNEFMQLVGKEFVYFDPETSQFVYSNDISLNEDEQFESKVFDKVRCATQKYVSKYERHAKFTDKIFRKHRNIAPAETYSVILKHMNQDFHFVEYYIALVDYYTKVITKEENAIKKAAEVFTILFYNFVTKSLDMKMKPGEFYTAFMEPMIKEEHKKELYKKAIMYLFNNFLIVGNKTIYDLK